MENFCIIAKNVNVQPIIDALNAQPELWDQNTVRTAHPESPHSEVQDIVVRFNKVTSSEYDGILNEVFNDHECFWYPSAFRLPLQGVIYALMRDVYGDRIGRCVITKLAPGGKVAAHIDQGSPVTHYQRFHIALQNGKGAVFNVGDESLDPDTGDVFVCANHKMHDVVNNSDIDRITMIVDIRTGMFEFLKQTV